MHRLESFITTDALDELVRRARAEDMGHEPRDITAEALIPPERSAEAHMTPRATGTLAGGALLSRAAHIYDPRIDVALHARDGDALTPGSPIATFTGPLRSILAMERIALNFVSHLSGIATLTAHYVARTATTRARIYDTRKTIPGLRALAKYAVVCGGGRSHRMGLHDAMLVKDNHIAGVAPHDLPRVLGEAIARARASAAAIGFVEVEVDTLAQLERVLAVKGVDVVLLDNMGIKALGEAVAMRDRVNPGVELEASGGVTLETVGAIAGTGVERIAVGAITHSAAAVDLGLDVGLDVGLDAGTERR